MKGASRVALTLAVLMFAFASQLTADQQKRKSQAPGRAHVWDVDFLMGTDHYVGTMTLIVSKGVVTGKMVIDTPTRIEADVAGRKTGNELSLNYPYNVISEGCDGRVQVKATFAPKATEATGTAHAVDCNGQPTDGTVTFKKAAAKAKTSPER